MTAKKDSGNNWTAWYIGVFLFLVAQVLFFYRLTQYFS
jgi:hypothetical protein